MSSDFESLIEETLLVFEANIDDLPPSYYEYVLELLLEAGALDVTITPILMKKSRPAHLLSVLAPPLLKQAVFSLLFEHTSTIGIRITEVKRYSLPRHIIWKETPLGKIRVKKTKWQEIIRQIPEYEDCKTLAKLHNLNLKTVYDIVSRQD